MSRELIKAADEKSARHITAAQDLVKDNPDGLTAEQQEEFDRHITEFNAEQDNLDKLAEAQRRNSSRDQDQAIHFDLQGMARHGEVAASILPDPQAEFDALREAGKDQNCDKVVEWNAKHWDAYDRMKSWGAGARDIAERFMHGRREQDDLATTTTSAPVPTITQAAFYERLYNVNGIRAAGGDGVQVA